MAKDNPAAHADKAEEAGVFYPRHCILIGLPDEDSIRHASDALMRSGIAASDVERIDNQRFAAQAQDNVENASWFASLGKSVHVHRKQMELAREGVQFLVIRAPESKDTERVVAALKSLPVRYAVKYETLVIEDLIQFFARRGDSSKELAV